MKKFEIILAIIFSFVFTGQLSSQVMILDSVFLRVLIEYGVDSNHDGQIQHDEAEALTTLEITQEKVTSLSGIEAFTQLKTIKMSKTLIVSVDLTNNLQLAEIILSDNELTEVNISNLPQLKRLALRNNEISTLDLSGLSNLQELDAENNNLSSIDLSDLAKLEDLDLDKNYFSTLDLSGLTNLLKIEVTDNMLDSLSFSDNVKLKYIKISDNNIRSIDVKHLKDLTSLVVTECPISTLDVAGLKQLFTLWISDSSVKTLFMKGTSPDPSQLEFKNTPLKFVCADQKYISKVVNELKNEKITDCVVTSVCPYTDEGVFGGISGKVKFGQSAEDCDSSSNYVPYPKLHTEWLNPNGQDFGILIGRKDGSYDVNYYGTMTLTPSTAYAPEWQHVIPEFSASNYSSNPKYHVQDFCMIPVLDKIAAQINIIPLNEFRAGFESDLILLVRNTGTRPFSGVLTLNFPVDSLTYVEASDHPSLIESSSIHWELQDLLPFNEKNIRVTMRVNSPMDTPPLFGNEKIQMCLNLTDNLQYQTRSCVEDFSVNSFDPNDKTYLGKDSITIEEINETQKLTYLIRFENTGSAEAINIVVSDAIDDTFIDPYSLQILDASHDVSLEMQENGIAQFIFSKIFLPFEDGLNRGYVLFSADLVKNNISINDQLNNRAAIYFDFNHPIITNDASIWILDEVSGIEKIVDEGQINIYPNPSTEYLTVESEINRNLIEKIEWTDENGRVVRVDNVHSGKCTFDDVNLPPGVYSIRITTEQFVQVQKVIFQGK